MPDAEVRSQYEARHPLLKALADSLEKETAECLAELPHIDRISFRAKGIDSFVAKTGKDADPPYENPLVEIEDQVAGRVIVFFLSDVEVVKAKLRGIFNTVEGRHRRIPERDDAFGYESHHLICVIPPHLVPAGWEQSDDAPNTFELQIRTIFMHAYSEPQHDFAYKAAADLPPNIRRELAWIAASAWGADQAYARVAEWAATQDEE